MKSIICLLLLGISLHADASQKWEEHGGSGKMQFVLIDKEEEKNFQIYREAINNLCKGKKFCKILFWTEKEQIPKFLPMSDKQYKAQTADFTLNKKTGYKQFSWACSVKKINDKCF